MVVRSGVRESRRELWFWRASAVAAMTVCAGLLAQTAGVGASGPRPGSSVRPEQRAERSTARRQVAAASSSERVRAALIGLEHAESSAARCTAIDRVVRLPDLDDEAVEQIARFTEPEHTLEVRRCAGYALGTVSHEVAFAPLRALAQCDNAVLSEVGLIALALRPDRKSQRSAIELSARAARTVRVSVASALAESGSLEAVPMIAALLDDGSWRDRERLLMALGRCGDPRAVGVLQSYIAKGSRMAQQAAIYALAEVGGPAATETLLTVLRERPELAQAAANALARTGGEEARTALLELAERGTNFGPGLSALQGLSELDGPGVSTLMQSALGEGGPQAQSVAIEYFVNHREHDVFATLSELAHAGTMQASSQALQALARIGGDRALGVVEAIAQGSGPMASTALQMLNLDQADPERARKIALAQAAQGNANALEVLYADDSPEARGALTKLALTGDSTVVRRALSSLALRSDAESRKLTESLARDADPQKRASAMWALAQSGDPTVVGTLRKGLSDSDENVRLEAVQALGQLTGPESEAALLSVSHDKSADIVGLAAQQLGQLGTPAALARLEEVARVPATAGQGLSALVNSAPTRAAPIAEALILGRDPESRRAALMVSSQLPADASTRIVVSALKSNDPDFVREALEMAANGNQTDEVLAAVRALREGALPDDVKARAAELAGSAIVGANTLHEQHTEGATH